MLKTLALGNSWDAWQGIKASCHGGKGKPTQKVGVAEGQDISNQWNAFSS